MRYRLVLFTLAIVCSGCYRVRIDSPVSGARTIEHKNHLFVLGMIGDPEIDLDELCPQGVTAFGDEIRPSDLLWTLLTVGIYSPKTSVIKCGA